MFRGAVPALVISNLGTGLEQVISTDELDANDDPVANNKIFTGGRYWQPSVDEIDSDWIGSKQVVFNWDDRETTGASYKTFDVNIPVQVGLAHDDDIATKPSWMSDWTDSGRDHLFGGNTMSIYTKVFSAGTITLGGNSGSSVDTMFICMVKPGYGQIANVGTTGSIEFASASYFGDDDGATITFYVNRVDGTLGAASATVSITTDTSPGSTLNTASVSWSDGDATQQAGTVTTPALSADDILTLGLSSFVGSSEGNRSSTDLFITDTGTTPSAQEYFIDTATGSDTNGGESSGDAWATIAKGNAVAPVAGGDVTIWVVSGTYTDDPIIPSNAGTDSTHRILWKPSGGDVTLHGPAGSRIDYAIDIGVDYIEIKRDSSNQFIVDGETPLTKGSYPNGRIKYGCIVRSGVDGAVLEYRHYRTVGYRGMQNLGNDTILRIEAEQHGTTLRDAGKIHFGDVLSSEAPSGAKTLIDGEGCGRWSASGHNLIRVGDAAAGPFGKGLMRHWHGSNDWNNVDPTHSVFDEDEGWRGGTIKSTQRWSVDDCIFERGGQAGSPGTGAAGWRLGDGDHSISRSFFINCLDQGLGYNGDDGIGWWASHCLFHNVWNRLVMTRNVAPQGGAKIFNCIFTDPIVNDSSSNDVVMYFNSARSDAEDNLHEFAYNVVPVGSYVWFHNQRILLTDAENDYPSVFHDNIFGTPNWVSVTTTPTFDNVYTGFALDTGSDAIDAGGDLTTVANSGSGTGLPVNDAGWFPDPLGFPNPTIGPANPLYKINHNGTLREYTAIDITATPNIITLAASADYTAGDTVNFPHTGSAPDCGPVQT